MGLVVQEEAAEGKPKHSSLGKPPLLYTGYVAALEVSEANIQIYTILRRKRKGYLVMICSTTILSTQIHTHTHRVRENFFPGRQ